MKKRMRTLSLNYKYQQSLKAKSDYIEAKDKKFQERQPKTFDGRLKKVKSMVLNFGNFLRKKDQLQNL